MTLRVRARKDHSALPRCSGLASPATSEAFVKRLVISTLLHYRLNDFPGQDADNRICLQSACPHLA
jgi:hypothetical protein